jgi:hypothetical protein
MVSPAVAGTNGSPAPLRAGAWAGADAQLLVTVGAALPNDDECLRATVTVVRS